MRAFYELVSYSPSGEANVPGSAVIRVIGCNTNTSLSVPAGTLEDDPTWQSVVAQVVSDVLKAVDPNSESYDSSLDNWANE